MMTTTLMRFMHTIRTLMDKKGMMIMRQNMMIGKGTSPKPIIALGNNNASLTP